MHPCNMWKVDAGSTSEDILTREKQKKNQKQKPACDYFVNSQPYALHI